MESRFPRGHSVTVDVTLSSSDIGRRGLWIVALVQSLQRDGESVVLIQRDGAGLIGWGKCLAKAQFPINNPLLQEMLIAPPKKVSSCFLMPTRSLPVFGLWSLLDFLLECLALLFITHVQLDCHAPKPLPPFQSPPPLCHRLASFLFCPQPLSSLALNHLTHAEASSST